MPENKPPFDPNKPSEVIKSKPPFDPNKPSVPIYDKTSSGTDYSFLNNIKDEAATDEIISKLDTKNDDEKQIIKNIAIAQKQGRASIEDLSNAILTVQGQHPKQDGGKKYYIKEENGVFKPVPIRNDERPPQGYDVASIWGSQENANNDSFLTSAAKHLVNGVVGAAEGVSNLAQIPYGALTGEELPWYQTMKNAGDYLKFKTPEYEQTGQLFDTRDLKEVNDFFDPSRYSFSKNNVQGAVLGGLESITSFLVGAKGLGGAAKTAGATAEGAGLITEGGKTAELLSATSNTGKLAKGFSSSYMINYDEALTAAENAGLQGQDKYAFASVATIPTALLEMVGGTEGMFIKNQLARDGKKQMFNSLAKGVVKDTDGKLTKESLEGLYNATTSAATKLNSTFAAELGKNIAGEAGTEAAQAFALNAAKNIYDKISGEDKFKTDPLSMDSWGEYVNNALAGGFGAAGPAVVGVSRKRRADMADLQSKNVFEAIKKGPEAISSLKADIDNSVVSQDLTKEQADVAKFKIDAYDNYYQQTKDLNLNDEDKRKAFDLSFTIEGIKSEIPTKESEIESLTPIELAKVQGKKNLIKGLQKELDAIVLKENVNKEPIVGEDTLNKVKKDEEKKAERTPVSELRKRYKPVAEEEVVSEDVKPERSAKRNAVPKFEAKDEGGNYEFNKLRPLEKKQALHDYFDENPDLNNEIEGFIEGGQNNVWKVDLGGTKRYIQFAKSIIPDEFTGEKKNFPGGKQTVLDSEGREYEKYTEPVGVRLESIKTDDGGRKRVINIYNKSTGKHIIFGKELEKGSSKYSEAEVKQLQQIQKNIIGGEKTKENVKQPVVNPVVKKESKSLQVKIEGSERTVLLDEGYSEKDINEAEKATNEVLTRSNNELASELEKKGLFNSVGKTEEWRPNIGLSTAEFKSALKNLKAGKETVASNRLSEFLDKVRETGRVDMIGQTGGMTEKFSMPLHQFLLGEKSERELTEAEIQDELEKEKAREEVFAETGQFQKLTERRGNIEKVVEKIKKSFPKVKIVYNPDLNAAGRLKGNVIEINPDYAGIDTPIHEAGHIMIDVIGYKNKTIQAGINQLKDTPLWKNTKDRYPELNEEQLGKEVLAEAIGMEGSIIFDTESAKNKFKAILSYIFDKIKQLFGIDKNVAKSLAKQIIGGIRTKDVTPYNNSDQYQKPKKPYKTLEEMSSSDLAKKLTMSLESYRENVLGRSLEQIRKDLQFINDALKSDEYSDEEKADLEDVKESINKEAKRDASKWFAYKEDMAMLSSILSEGRLEDMPDDKLIEAYNLMVSGDFQNAAKEAKLNQLKQQIGYRMFVKRKEELKGYNGFVEEQANKKDLSAKDVLMRNLGHMTQNQPELQKFSKIFDDTYFNMQEERYDLKTQLESIGKEIIKEKNRSLGITDKAKEFVMSGSIKYFDFVEHPEGRYYTLEEAKQKGFTPAQTKFLKFMLKLNDLRNEQLSDMDIDQVNNEVLKVDKGVKEAFREEGILQAFSSLLGNGHNIQNVRINYNGKPTSYGEIERDLIAKGNKSVTDKMKSLLQMLKYQLAARRQLKTGTNIDEKENPLALSGGSEYNLSTDGRLKSKFNKPRDKSRGYSKDFYKAAHSFIDDYTHVKHFNPILPYIQSIEYLNKMGFAEHEKKENVAEWVKQWTDLHILKKEKVGALGPELDTFFKLMRKLTSLSVMAFNYPAGGWNLAMGIYNNIRAESAEIEAKGLKRLFGGTDRAGYGAYNKKASELLKKYQVVSVDLDSNPKIGGKKIFDTLAHGVTRAGEYTIQGSLFLGLLTDEEYNSFEFKNIDGVQELVLKDGVDADKIKNKFIEYKNRISDIQGKYSEKDRRNFQAGEFGKAMSQFRLWALDWLAERFGSRYIDPNGNVKVGSWRPLFEDGFAELRADIKKEGVKAIWNNKEAMANLKGLMTVAVFLSLGLGGDDDKKKRDAADNIDKALGNLLFIFDPGTLKFTLEHPIASMAIVTRFVGAVEAGTKFNWDLAGKEITNITPYNKIVKQAADLIEEE